MKSLVVYDSQYGNTEKVAGVVADVLRTKHINANSIQPSDLEEVELLVVGSPTQGGRPTEAIKEFLSATVKLSGVRVAAFDTRIQTKWVKIFGYAANVIADRLQKNGGELILNPEGFFVKGTSGPLLDNELKRAEDWTRKLVS